MTQRYIPHARALLALGLPIIGSHLAQMALHVTDTILLGRYGVTELASVVIATTFFFVIFIFGSGFAQAVMPLVAAAVGRGDEVQVRRDALVAQHQRQLDQAGHAGRGLEVADVGLRRSHQQRLLAPAVHVAQSVQLDRVA